MRLNWKTALDKYTIQVLITVQQLLITYLLTAELKVSIISFNKQLLYAVRNVCILSMIPLHILFHWIKYTWQCEVVISHQYFHKYGSNTQYSYVKHCQQYYNDTHFIQLGEVGVIQLCRNNPDMTEIVPSQYSRTSPPHPCLSEQLKDDFLEQLSLSINLTWL